MQVVKTERGFEVVIHPKYIDPNENVRVVGKSSAIGNYEDSFERPGTSFLWVGSDLHLNREEVAELRDRLTSRRN